jgi:RHS repeat-associated protein
LITGANGKVISQHDLTAFGMESAPNVTSMRQEVAAGLDREEPMKFTGHERDLTGGTASENDTSLDYMHARYYTATMGRFLSADRAERNPANPQSWNAYEYALNSPVRLTDPTGDSVDGSQLTEDERKKILYGLRYFTGNVYQFDKQGMLQLVALGGDRSPSATNFLNQAIGSKTNYLVVSVASSSQWNEEEQRVEIDFNKLDNVNYGKVGPATYNYGSTLIHELIHGVTGLRDLHPDGSFHDSEMGWTGPVVDIENDMRAERGLPLRESYLVEAGRRNTTTMRFTHVDPKRPDKVFVVTGLKP